MVSSKAVAAAAAVWVLLHAVLLLLSLGESDRPALYLLAALVAVAITGYALAPLLGRPSPLRRGHALGLACVYLAVAATVTSTLSPVGFVGYANWWPGLLAPLLAALVLRRQAMSAVVAAAGGAVVLFVGALLTQAPGERLGTTITLAFPLAIWPLGALAFRAVFDRADQVVADLRRGAASTSARAQRGDAHDLAVVRVLEEALPMLSNRVEGRTPTADDEVRARDAETAVRDEIRGGRLLSAETRRGARALRADGWTVVIDDYAAHDATADPEAEHVAAVLLDVAQAVMAACLRASHRGRLELTAPSDPVTRLTVLVQATPASLPAVIDAASAALRPGTGEQRHSDVDAHLLPVHERIPLPARFGWSLDIVVDETDDAPHMPRVTGVAPQPALGDVERLTSLWVAVEKKI